MCESIQRLIIYKFFYWKEALHLLLKIFRRRWSAFLSLFVAFTYFYGVSCRALLLLNSFSIKIVALLSLTTSVDYDFFMSFLQIILIYIADVYPRFEV